MNQSNGRQGTLYEQVLEYARREIDEASSKIDELRRTLRLLEARVEAAKSVYESVAARLNLEDELEEGVEFQEASYPETPPPLHAPEPPEEPEGVGASGNGNRDGFSAELIRQHLERQARQAVAQDEGARSMASKPEPTPPEKAGLAPEPEEEEKEKEEVPAASGFPGLSEADRQLIGEYLRAKRGG